MHSTLSICDLIHARALEAASRYKRAESELIEVLQEADQHRVYLKRRHASLFKFVTDELRLGENVAYSLITIARKACEVPELKEQLQAGAITLSNARRIAP